MLKSSHLWSAWQSFPLALLVVLRTFSESSRMNGPSEWTTQRSATLPHLLDSYQLYLCHDHQLPQGNSGRVHRVGKRACQGTATDPFKPPYSCSEYNPYRALAIQPYMHMKNLNVIKKGWNWRKGGHHSCRCQHDCVCWKVPPREQQYGSSHAVAYIVCCVILLNLNPVRGALGEDLVEW